MRLLALRPLRARPVRSLLSAVGIAAGVALVLAIQLINTAISASVRGSVDAIAGRARAEVTAPTDGGVPEAVVAAVQRRGEVEQAVGLIRADGVLAGPGERTVVTLLGVPPPSGAMAPPGTPTRLDGGFGSETGTPGVVLPDGLAARLGVELGDRLELSARSARVRVRVSGLLRTGRLAGGAGVALMALPVAQRELGSIGRVDQVLVVPRPGVGDEALREAVRAAVATVAPSGLAVRPPAARANQADRVLRGIRQLLTLASTVALFVGMFVVVNTMTMAVTERRREFALLQALGLRRREQARLLRVEAALLGVAGSLGGVAGGWLLARVLVARVAAGYATLLQLPPVTITVRPLTVLGAFAAGVTAALAAAVVPVRRLRSLPPVEGMRAGVPTEDAGESAPTARRAVAAAVPALAVTAAAMVVFLYVAPVVGWAVLGLCGLLVALAAVIPLVVPVVIGWVSRPLAERAGLAGRLAGQALLRTPRRTSYTVGALLVTLMLVIGLGGALGSFRASLTRLLGVVSRGDVYVVPRDEFTTTLPADLADEVNRVPGVTAAWRYRLTPVLWGDTQVAMQSWDMAPFRRQASLLLESGDLDAAWDAALAGTGVIVSTTLAADRGLAVGDRVALPTPTGSAELTVTAVSTDFLPQGTFYLDWPVAQRLYGEAGATSIAVVTAPGRLDEVRRDLAALVARRGLDAELQSRQQRSRTVLAGVDQTFALAGAVQLAGLAVALVAMVNTLLMAVVERQREIGVLRALGLLRRQVRRMVLAEALVMGVVGGMLASAAGYALSIFVTKAMEVGNRWTQVGVVPWRSMAAAPVVAALVAACGAVWPAHRAARTQITEAIRSE